MLSCLGISRQTEKDDAPTDEIVKARAFDTGQYYGKRSCSTSYETVICNDVDLLKLRYLGSVDTSFTILKHIFGKPQQIDCYKGPYAFELVWYIKFNRGTNGYIGGHFKNERSMRYRDRWKVYGSSDKALKNIILLLL